MPERSMATVLAPLSLDLEETLTATEAADEFGVHLSTITSWRRKGYLEVAGYDTRDGRRVPVYRRGDVGLAERATRRRALNKRAAFATRETA